MKEEEKYIEKPFPIHSYSKGELALLYCPGIQQQSAVDKLNEWINTYPGLKERLIAIGLQKRNRIYTPAQVRLIVEALGEP